MTPAESVTRLYGLYTETVTFLNENGWQGVPRDANVLGIAPQDCVLTDNSAGVTYADSLLGPGHANAYSAAQNVAAYWKSAGLSSTIDRSTNPKNPDVTTSGSNNILRAQYVVNPERSYISVVTYCVTGDSDKLIEGVQKRRESDSTKATPPGPEDGT